MKSKISFLLKHEAAKNATRYLVKTLRSALICLFCLSAIPSFAQVPNLFSFQGVARNGEGKILANKSINLRITIHSESSAGPSVYQELHNAMTSPQGIFNIAVGGGNVQSGNFSTIDWKISAHFIQIEMDPDGGNSLIDLGTTQLLSVPYAQHANEASRWQRSYPVVQKFEIGSDIDINDPNDPDIQKYLLPHVGEGQRLIWYPAKGAFRAGSSNGVTWEENAIGNNSTAFGSSNLALGSESMAFGLSNQATGNSSIAFGENTSASGMASASLGNSTNASGYAAIAMGVGTVSKVEGSIAAGIYNDVSDNPVSAQLPLDRIFQIGNGISIQRSNALTVLRNGFMGIGQSAKDPKYFLDVAGRARIQHNGETAGVFFNNSANAAAGFVGMVNDNEIGFFVGGGWKYFVNSNGNATLTGTLSQNSDRRLKRDFNPLTSSLGKINTLKGYQYYWKDGQKDQSLQTGLIAQEVETSFPELVTTDTEGFKSVNYMGLIPHLIESIKDLKAEVERLKKDRE
ncbi:MULTISPECIES: tail fiber domain-containing protein [Dyadobacter]|uniref:Tail fiber domain-containing protein n=1 Tax=Dyadobacter chenhuakuii TaxID=2909339 RepID=A0A9X1TQX3_9BACT|nr:MULTISPECIES: tail fiber domain-containing protein [Dyadobacter]MCF2497304.1 tail fiber domain-containing protein [Dyadobacter chenhuakuii]MCF2516907.1 tail fiber domain-containing protein [Dyadobacter sp. CY351]